MIILNKLELPDADINEIILIDGEYQIIATKPGIAPLVPFEGLQWALKTLSDAHKQGYYGI